tara:strand:+ start:111 stop:230 length:120 start_codon:yes stop_codon:yes gene_type:complete
MNRKIAAIDKEGKTLPQPKEKYEIVKAAINNGPKLILFT